MAVFGERVRGFLGRLAASNRGEDYVQNDQRAGGSNMFEDERFANEEYGPASLNEQLRGQADPYWGNGRPGDLQGPAGRPRQSDRYGGQQRGEGQNSGDWDGGGRSGGNQYASDRDGGSYGVGRDGSPYGGGRSDGNQYASGRDGNPRVGASRSSYADGQRPDYQQSMHGVAQPGGGAQAGGQSGDRPQAQGNVIQFPNRGGGQSIIIKAKPDRYADAEMICQHLRERHIVIFNLSEMDYEEARRIFDFVSGAVCVLDASIDKHARMIYSVAPNNVARQPFRDESHEAGFESYGGRGSRSARTQQQQRQQGMPQQSAQAQSGAGRYGY